MIYSEFVKGHLSEKQKNVDLLNYYFFNNMFNDSECSSVKEYCNFLILNRAKIFTYEGLKEVKDYRSSDISHIEYNDQTRFIYEKFGHATNSANKIWDFDISGMLENIQYTRYKGDEAGKYAAHIDLGKKVSHRKISIILQLSDPSEYEGGDFLIWVGKDPIVLPKEKGTVICFPSYILHEVKPITKGVRESLVCWVSGPPFR